MIYMASSVSGTMKQILLCDWLPKQTRWCYYTYPDEPLSSNPLVPQEKCFSEIV